MKNIFTKHLNKRLQKRNIGSHKVTRLLGVSGAKYLGGNKYKITKSIGGRDVTVIYKKEGSKRIGLTSWKK